MSVTAFALLSLALLSSRADAPVTLPAQMRHGLWTIAGTLDGKKAIFMIDSGANRTAILAKGQPSGDQLISIQVGGLGKIVNAYRTDLMAMQVMATDLRRQSPDPPEVVLLGIDVLGQIAVGFDLSRLEVSIWPTGIEKEAALAWAGSNSTPATAISLERRESEFGVPAAVGDEKGWLMLDTGSDQAMIAGRFASTIGSISLEKRRISLASRVEEQEFRLAPQVILAGRTVPWWYVSLSPGDPFDSWTSKKPDGILALADFGSSRVLLDFPRSLLAIQDLEPNALLSRIFSRLTSLPFTVEGDSIKVGPVPPAGPEALRPYDGCSVRSIRDVSASEILSALRHPTLGSAMVIKSLFPGPGGTGAMVLDTKDGPKTIRLQPGS